MHITDRKDEPDLRADTGDPRLETADLIAGAAITPNLIVEIADGSNKKLFG